MLELTPQGPSGPLDHDAQSFDIVYDFDTRPRRPVPWVIEMPSTGVMIRFTAGNLGRFPKADFVFAPYGPAGGNLLPATGRLSSTMCNSRGELQLPICLGMTPMDAIPSATRNGAEALGNLDEVGTIEEGKLADVIVVPWNPLLDMNVMKRVYVTIKGGVRYK